MNATAWSRGLEVTGGGTGVVSHAGLVLLRQLADRTGLTAGLSAALPSPDGGLDRGRVFADLACAIADGARVISDFRASPGGSTTSRWLCTFCTPPMRCAAAAASRYCGEQGTVPLSATSPLMFRTVISASSTRGS